MPVNVAGVVNLEVYGPLELSLSLAPRELVVSRGCNASIRCQTVEWATFVWLFNYGALPGNVQHELEEGPLSSTLSVLGTSAGNQGLYTCVANSAVRSMSSSSTSFVNVIDPPLLLSVEPTFLHVLVGGGVVLKCTAQQPCLGSQPAFQWSRQGRKALSSQAKIETKDDGSVLKIDHVTRDDDGVYYCHAALYSSVAESAVELRSLRYASTAARASGTSLGMETTLPAAVPAPTPSSASSSTVSSLKASDIQRSSVSISAPLQISLFPSDIRLKVGQSANLLCEATSAVTLTWLFRYTSFLPWNVEVVEGQTQSSLTIHSMTADNGGEYVCVATLAGNSPLYTISSVIFLEAITIEVVPNRDVLVAENGATNFTCTLTCGCSGTQLTWQRGGSVLPSTALYSGREIVLYLENVKRSDEGTYTCVATNGLLGMASVDVRLQVNASSSIPPLLPTISIVPGVLSIAEGLSANFTCNSSQPAQFVWSFNAVVPLPGNVEVQNVTSRVSVLRVVSAGLTNAGSYYCKALFADGQATTAYADLIFIETLKVKIQSVSPLTVSNGTALSVVCSLDCSCGGAHLSWSRAGYQALPSSAAVTLGNSGRSLTLSFPVATTDIDATMAGEKARVPPGAIPNSMSFALGGLAGMTATVFVQPLDLLKNRMQLSGLLETFKTNNSLLEQIQKCLEDYLESKRLLFSRF
eukprot:Em0030g28a